MNLSTSSIPTNDDSGLRALFPNREYHPILRLYIPHWNADKVIADAVAYMEETGIRDLLLFSDAQYLVWNQLSPKEIDTECATLTKAIRYFREHGARSVGLNTSIMQMQSTADHRCHEDYDYYLTDRSGVSDYRLPCPMDPKLLTYIDHFYASLAKTGPDFIFMDDDLRYMYTEARNTIGCCCPLHQREFAKLAGRPCSPQEMQELLMEKPELRAKYLELLGENLKTLARRIRQAVKATNPAIRLGLMVPCTHTVPVSGSRISNVVAAICGNDRPLTRPCIGPYDDLDHKMVLAGLFHMELTRHLLGDDVDYTPEIEVAPPTSISKAPTIVRLYMIQGILNGMPAPLFSPVGYCGDTPYLDAKFPVMLKQNRPYFEALTRIAPEPTSRLGLQLFANLGAAAAHKEKITSVFDLFFPCCSVHNILDSTGIPHTYEDSPAAFLCGIHAEPLTDENCRKLLSKTLILDAHAAQILCRRGYGRFIGIRDVQPISPYCGSELTISQEYFGRYTGSYISIKYLPKSKCRMLLPDDRAEALTQFVNYDLEQIGPATLLCHNDLGGHILILPFIIDECCIGDSAYPVISLHRQTLLHNFIQRYAPEMQPVEFAEGTSVAVQYWKEPTKITLSLINFSYDILSELPLQSHLDLGKAVVLDDNGIIRPLDFSNHIIHETLLPFRPLIIQFDIQ